jgi:hypothetical protein
LASPNGPNDNVIEEEYRRQADSTPGDSIPDENLYSKK